MRLALALAISLLAGNAFAAECRYVDQMGDVATYDGSYLDLVWAPVNGAGEVREHCPTMATGTGMIQRTARCSPDDGYLFSFGPSKRGGKQPDIMALEGMVWYRTCMDIGL